jgi:hypothetical protein
LNQEMGIYVQIEHNRQLDFSRTFPAVASNAFCIA